MDSIYKHVGVDASLRESSPCQSEDDTIYYSDVMSKLFGPSVDGCIVSLTLFTNLFNTGNKYSTLLSYAHTPISQKVALLIHLDDPSWWNSNLLVQKRTQTEQKASK